MIKKLDFNNIINLCYIKKKKQNNEKKQVRLEEDFAKNTS